MPGQADPSLGTTNVVTGLRVVEYCGYVRKCVQVFEMPADDDRLHSPCASAEPVNDHLIDISGDLRRECAQPVCAFGSASPVDEVNQLRGVGADGEVRFKKPAQRHLGIEYAGCHRAVAVAWCGFDEGVSKIGLFRQVASDAIRVKQLLDALPTVEGHDLVVGDARDHIFAERSVVELGCDHVQIIRFAGEEVSNLEGRVRRHNVD